MNILKLSKFFLRLPRILILFLFFAYSFIPQLSYSQIILSEIMFDPIGNENYDEFIEIYNLSSTDSIDLAGWQICDGSGIDNIICHEKGTKLAPQQFGLILDSGYFENSNQYQGLIPDKVLILTIDNKTFGSSGLSNSKAENIFIFSSIGDTVANYIYSINNEPGYSDEKIDLSSGDDEGNWSNSKILNGTPGATNSVSPLEYDLSLTNINYTPQNPIPEDEVTLIVKVENIGRFNVNGFQLTSYLDLNYDGIYQNNEQIGDVFLTEQLLISGETFEAEIHFFVSLSGKFNLFLKLESSEDINVLNDSLTTIFSAGFPARTLIVNEIMYSPKTSKAEWIEIFNRSNNEVNIQNWEFSDSDSIKNNQITDTYLLIPPQSFFILSKDSTILEQFNLINCHFITYPSWQSLNNENDNIFLFDQNKNIIDEVSYYDFWGGDQGISLERINPNLASNDSSNWNSSVNFYGGTPGEQNSIFVDVLPSDAELSISPNPFSPDGDGRDDITIISYELPFNLSQVHIKIYDIRGRLVKTLINNQPSGMSRSTIWDGKDKNGNICRMGIYIVYLEAIHYQRGVVKSLKKSVVLAKNL